MTCIFKSFFHRLKTTTIRPISTVWPSYTGRCGTGRTLQTTSVTVSTAHWRTV